MIEGLVYLLPLAFIFMMGLGYTMVYIRKWNPIAVYIILFLLIAIIVGANLDAGQNEQEAVINAFVPSNWLTFLNGLIAYLLGSHIGDKRIKNGQPFLGTISR